MAYTYEDFVSAANKAGLMNQFSAEDLAITQTNPEYGLSILNLKQDAAKATTGEQRALATEAENQIRSTYAGYKGSFDTQIKDLTGQIGSYGDFTYDKEQQLQDKLGQVSNYAPFQYGNENAYKQLLDRITNQEDFKYSLEDDSTWGSLKKSYLREGERASANALEQASAGSGGIPSTYAVQAAQQAANYYNSQLNDMIPTLEQNAYQRYLNDISSRIQQLGALQTDREFDYQDYMNQYNIAQNALSVLQNDKATQQNAFTDKFNMLQQQLGIYQQQDATDYNRYIDALNMAYQKEQAALAQKQQELENQLTQQQYQDALKQQELENAMALYSLLGYATPEVAALLGIEAGVPVTTASTGSGGSSGSGIGAGGYDFSDVFNTYPGGAVTDESYWNSLKGLYGEDVLTAAGIYYHAPQSLRVDRSSLEKLGLGSLSDSEVNDLVEKGKLEETVKNDVISFRAAGTNTGNANKSGKKALSVLDRKLTTT